MQYKHQECSRNDWISKTLTFSEVQCVCHSNPIVFEELKLILNEFGILKYIVILLDQMNLDIVQYYNLTNPDLNQKQIPITGPVLADSILSI